MADSAGLPSARSAVEPSPLVCARRVELLGELVGTMRGLHRRRRRRRRLAAAGSLAAIGIAVAMLAPTAGVPETGSAPLLATGGRSGSVPAPRVNLAFVETDPGVVDRYAAAGARRTVFVDDQSLLGALAAIDRPTGLVRRGGRVWLTEDVLAP